MSSIAKDWPVGGGCVNWANLVRDSMDQINYWYDNRRPAPSRWRIISKRPSVTRRLSGRIAKAATRRPRLPRPPGFRYRG